MPPIATARADTQQLALLPYRPAGGMQGNKSEVFHQPIGCEKMVNASFNVSRSISGRASCARKCLFFCSSISLPARWTACAWAARTQRTSSASLTPATCATRVAACPSWDARQTTSVRNAASYLVRCRLGTGSSAFTAGKFTFVVSIFTQPPHI